MTLRRRTKSAALMLSNVLLPIAVLAFASGFFPHKPLLPGLATLEEDVQGLGEKYVERPEAVFDRVVFMVVDALRSDFVYGHNSGFAFTQSLIRSGAAVPFTARATPPTVTMPRVKALTTGSVPSFLDLILNFAEGDTTSSLATQDTWLAQIRAKGGRLVFYGDDTWLKLFPGDFFARSDGTSSFFVSDFTEVDHNVTRHVPEELARDDWDAMIMHYLGLDHIGHKTGPNGPNMLPKQAEMDGIVKVIYEAMEAERHHANTLLVLAGDHGMNAGGNHGGSGPGETEPALLFASPKFKDMRRSRQYECPTSPKEGTEFHYYTKVEQSDVLPAIAGMMGIPISKNSLGVFIPELAGVWREEKTLRLLLQNSEQMLRIVRAKYGEESFSQSLAHHYEKLKLHDEHHQHGTGSEDDLAYRWASILLMLDTRLDSAGMMQVTEALYEFLYLMQEAMSDTASSYDIPWMMVGMIIMVFAVILTSMLLQWNAASMFLGTASLLYGAMMFASSYVEEEQHFWYWLTPAWISFLAIANLMRCGKDNGRAVRVAVAALVLLTTHRVSVRWNQTGQKHAGEPDVVHTFFPENHMLMWILILSTYGLNGFMLHTRTFADIFMPEITAFADVSLVVSAIVFKLNFTQADAPELVQGLALRIREWSAPLDLVFQARGVFILIAMSTVAVVVLSIAQTRSRTDTDASSPKSRISLTERLHPLLTLFLMTQTRAPNVPLFLALELQMAALSELVQHEDRGSTTRALQPLTAAVTVSTLLLSHVYYFCMGGSNSISSIDLSNAYNGVADYNIAAVGVLLFAGNWAGPIWWCSAAVRLLMPKRSYPVDGAAIEITASESGREWIVAERAKLRQDTIALVKPRTSPQSVEGSGDGSWFLYISGMTLFVSVGLLAVMVACTLLRTHLFIWTVFSPKYLYTMAWSVGWHLLINVGFGNLLQRFGRVS